MRFLLIIFLNSFLTIHISAQPVQKDRWIVMDFSWFRPGSIEQQADSLFDRYLPLWHNASGDKGIILSFNWVLDIITDYSGDINQKLPLKSPNSAWWNEKTYKDVKEFVAILKARAASFGMRNFHVGMECIAWPSLVMVQGKYNYPSNWSERHPELYKNYEVIDPLCKLNMDNYKYATRPGGIKSGELFSGFFGEQWGAVSKATGMDALLLWDSWATLKCYNRNGVFGDRASKDPKENNELKGAIIRTFRDIKNGNPDALLMGYSSGASAIGELRVNTFDLEALVADGCIDVWIDQTWGGAWNDFWGMERDGWTFQLAYQLQHELMIEAGNAKRVKPCRHYNIVAPLDAYEPWDVIHSTPNKLKWSIWAQNNACILTPKGYKTIDGSMVAWANSPFMKLLSVQDVSVIADAMDAADKSATEMKAMHGATFVYNRIMMDWLDANDPASLNSEWIDEQVAMLMKWGIPCLSATRTEWIPTEDTVGKTWIYQLPGHLNASLINQIGITACNKCPQLFVGRADRLDEGLLHLAGLSLNQKLYPSGDYECVLEGNPETGLAKNTNVFLSEFSSVNVTNASVYVRTPETPLVTQSDKMPTFYWQPPDWRHPSQAGMALQQYGSIVPYYTLVREMQLACRRSGLTHISPMQVMNPVTFHFWESGNRIYFLLGNLESGTIGDSRKEREVSIYLNTKEMKLDNVTHELTEYYKEEKILPFDTKEYFQIYHVKIEPNGMGLYYLNRQ